jgi:hypothetical protein
MPCNPDWMFWGPAAVIAAPVFLYAGFRAWTRPQETRAAIAAGFEPWAEADSVSAFLRLTREQAAGPAYRAWRIAAPLLGAALAIGGISAIVAQIRCGFPLVGPIAFRSLDGPEIIGLIFWFLLSIVWPARANRSNPRRASASWLVLIMLLATLAVFAGTEAAAAYHSGIQEYRWAALSLIIFATVIIIFSIALKQRRSDVKAENPHEAGFRVVP